MLKAVKITDQQFAGRTLRPYLNGFGYQLRLAVANRKMQELTLPEVEKTKRLKGKGNKPAQLVVDPRRRRAHVTLRRLKKALDAFNQWKNPKVGAFPVEEDQSNIPYICLGASDETENRKSHPKKWMGKTLKNPRKDRAKLLCCLLNFLMPPFQLGNMKGDAKHYDKKGNLKIVKEEPESEPETKSSENESESSDEDEDKEAGAEFAGETEAIRLDEDVDQEAEAEPVGETGANRPDSDSDIEIIEVIPKTPKEPPKIIDIEGMATEERVEDILGNLKSEPNPEEDEPTLSTSAASNMVPANLGQVPGHIQIDWQTMAKLFIQHQKANQEASPKIGNVPVKWVPERQELAITAPKEEPKNDEPSKGNKEQESDTEKFIQSLEDHLAALPTAPPNPQNPETDSGVEKNPSAEPHRRIAMSGYESEANPVGEQEIRKQIMQDSELENQGVEEVVSSSSSQKEITVDPSNFGEPKGVTNDQSPLEEGEVNDQNP